MFEARIAARRAANASKKELIDLNIEGAAQIENMDSKIKVLNRNPNFGFKCGHYAVTENSGVVKLTIVKYKKGQEFHFKVRTMEVKDATGQSCSAKETTHFIKHNEIYSMQKSQDELVVEIGIVDNKDYGPELEFEVELQDMNDNRLPGDDTKTVISILEDDRPGQLSFEETEIKVFRKQKKFFVKILREEGTDGRISCLLKTEAMYEQGHETEGLKNAIPFEDYEQKHEIIKFENGESECTVEIKLFEKLVNKKDDQAAKEITEKADDDDEEDDGDKSEEEHPELKFKVIIEDAQPERVKLSRKNLCYVTIMPEELEQ